MKRVSIRTVQHRLAAMIVEGETGGEIVIMRHGRPVAQLSATAPNAGALSKAISPAAIRSYWRRRPLTPTIQSTVTQAALITGGRGPV